MKNWILFLLIISQYSCSVDRKNKDKNKEIYSEFLIKYSNGDYFKFKNDTFYSGYREVGSILIFGDDSAYSISSWNPYGTGYNIKGSFVFINSLLILQEKSNTSYTFLGEGRINYDSTKELSCDTLNILFNNKELNLKTNTKIKDKAIKTWYRSLGNERSFRLIN